MALTIPRTTAFHCLECGGEVRYRTGNAANKRNSWHQHLNHSTVHARWVAEQSGRQQRSPDPLLSTSPSPSNDEAIPAFDETAPPTTHQIAALLERIAPSIFCVVCTEPMIEAYSIETCRHSLCKGCIDHLVDLMQPCPLCRGEIRTAQKDWTLSNVISEMYRAAAATLLHLPVRARAGDAAVGAMPVAVPTALPRAELRPRVPDSGQRVHTTEAPRARAAAAVTPPSGLFLLPPQEQRDMVRPLMPINRCSDAFLDQLRSNCRTDRDVCYAVFRVWIPDLDLTQILGDSH